MGSKYYALVKGVPCVTDYSTHSYRWSTSTVN